MFKEREQVKGEPRSEVLCPRAFWKIPFLPIKDKKHFYHAEMSAFKSIFFPRKALWVGSSWTDCGS